MDIGFHSGSSVSLIVTGPVLFIVAVLGGALNSVAGGGSFLTFPTLLISGVLPVQANATSTVALWPGSLTSAAAYRRELLLQRAPFLLWLSAISVAGGLIGAVALLHTPQATFIRLVPWLLLLATVLFTFGGPLTVKIRRRTSHLTGPSWLPTTLVGILQLVIAVYGGFFGGGIGILMLASLALIGMENIHQMNAIKTLLAGCINGVAVLTFIIAGAVAWPQALLMLVGSIAGGYGGASYARRADPRLVRRFVIAVGVVMTLYFFIRR
jgi:uncharacterized protein